MTTTAEVIEGDFIYRLVSEEAQYSEDDMVDVYAELEYIGELDEVTISHAASPFYFPMVEETRDYKIDYAMNEPLLYSTLIKRDINPEYPCPMKVLNNCRTNKRTSHC